MRYLLSLACCALAFAQAPDKWTALDRALEADVRSRVALVDNALLGSYAQTVAARLNPNARVALIADSEPGPIALPGGLVFVPLDLFGVARNEAEFAASLARAIASVEIVRDRPSTPLILFGAQCRLGPQPEISRRAAGLLDRAGYDVEALAAYLTRAGCGVEGLPAPDPTRETVLDTSAFVAARREAARITAKPPRRVPSLRAKG